MLNDSLTLTRLFFYRLYVTQHYIAFHGWLDNTRILLPLHNVVFVEKSNTMLYVPNALSITTQLYGDYFFGSFIDRDQCYNLIVRMSEVCKRLLEFKEYVEPKHLLFGNQTAISEKISSPNSNPSRNSNTNTGSDKLPTELNDVVKPVASIDKRHADESKASPKPIVEKVKVEAAELDDRDDGIQFSKVFSNPNITILSQHKFACSSDDYWKMFWQNSNGFE